MSEVLDKTKKALRAVLISAPRGVPVRMLCRDFKTVLGYELPYKQLGFHRLEEFIRTIPDVARLGTNNGDPTYYAVADEKTSQILRFVTSQKKPKVKKSGAPPMTQRPMAVSGFTKKSRYGPMSRSKPGGGSGGGGYLGRSFQGGYKSPIGHQYNYSTRCKFPEGSCLVLSHGILQYLLYSYICTLYVSHQYILNYCSFVPKFAWWNLCLLAFLLLLYWSMDHYWWSLGSRWSKQLIVVSL